MKKIFIAIALSVLVVLSSCQQEYALPFDEIMNAETVTPIAEERVPFEGFEEYMQLYKEDSTQMGFSGAIVRLKPMKRTQYMILETEDNGRRSLDGKTMVTVEILDIFDIQGDVDLSVGDIFDIPQSYYLQPKDESGFEEMFVALGGTLIKENGITTSVSLDDGTYEYRILNIQDHQLMLWPNILPLSEEMEYYAFLWFKDDGVSFGQIVPAETSDISTLDVYQNIHIDPDLVEIMYGLHEYAEECQLDRD